MTIRQAGSGDLRSVQLLWDHARLWLERSGSDQWQYPANTDRIAASIAAGECWVVDDLNRFGGLAATITTEVDADPQLWWPDDSPTDALYLSRMVVHRAAAGNDLGSALLDWAGRRAQSFGWRWLRLNAWTTNGPLRGYYERCGFQLVRVVPGRRAGACYQRDASVQLGRGPMVTAQVAGGDGVIEFGPFSGH